MRRSVGSISGSSVSSSAGTASNDANAVWRRALRVERRDADEAVHAPLAREQPVRVPTLDGERRRAESRPRCPGCTSSISTAKPRRSAQRVNMRSSISVQSCASVPPAPEFTSQIASRSSCSPVNSARSSSVSSSARERGEPGLDLGLDRVVALLAAELVQRLEVGDRAVEPVDELDVVAARAASSVVTLRAASGSSQRSGLLASTSSSSSRARAVVERR